MEFRETLAKIFGIKRKETPASTPPPEQTPATTGSFQDRTQRMQERRQRESQAVFSHQVDQAKAGRVPIAPDMSSAAVHKRVESIAAEQTLEEAEEVRRRSAPVGTSGERFRRLTQTPGKQAEQPQEPPKEETKTPPLDATRLEKSLKTPFSEWGKPKTSVAPFPEGTFPGVEKWKPGKGALNMEDVTNIRREVQKDKYGYSKPPSSLPPEQKRTS